MDADLASASRSRCRHATENAHRSSGISRRRPMTRRAILVADAEVPTRARLYGVALPSPNETWSGHFIRSTHGCRSRRGWKSARAGAIYDLLEMRIIASFEQRAAGFAPDVFVPRYAQIEHIMTRAGRSPCRSCKPSARPPARPPVPPAAAPPPRAPLSACCRCRRSNGTSRSRARPRISTSASRPSSRRSSGRSSRPT